MKDTDRSGTTRTGAEENRFRFHRHGSCLHEPSPRTIPHTTPFRFVKTRTRAERQTGAEEHEAVQETDSPPWFVSHHHGHPPAMVRVPTNHPHEPFHTPRYPGSGGYEAGRERYAAPEASKIVTVFALEGQPICRNTSIFKPGHCSGGATLSR